MNAKKFLFSLLLMVTFIACKNEEKQEVKVDQKDFYKLTLSATVIKDDQFQVYYKESNDDQEPFEEVNSVRVDLKGSDNVQNVVFNLPADVYPTYLRLDFGSNKEQAPIVIKEFKIEFQGKSFVVNAERFFDYFIAEKSFLNFDKATSTAIPFVTKDGNYDPMFFSESTLNAEMVKMAQ